MDILKLVVLLLIYMFDFTGSSTQNLPCHTASGDNCTSSICPNTVVNYTCTIRGTAAGNTDWTLPTGTCPTNAFPDKIRLSQFVSQQCGAVGSGVPSMCGPYRASSIQSSDPMYCLSSILTVNITAAMNGSTVMCNNTNIGTSASTLVSMATINVIGLPGAPNAVANTIGPDMVLVVVNPSSSGGLPTSYNVTISNSTYEYSNSTPAFLNGSAMVTFTGLTIGTNYTTCISAVAINCAGSSNPTTLYVSSNNIDIIAGIVIGGLVFLILIIVAVVLLICLCSSSKTSTMNKIGGHPVVEEIDLNIAMMPPPCDPIATPQASSVPAKESLYDGMFTQDQRVPEESLYDGGVGPAGNVPTGRGGNVQEAVYSQPDTSKKNANLVDQVLDPVAPMVNDEKLEHNNGSTFATLDITAPHSNEEAPSVDCEPIISRSQYPFRQATKYSSMECTGNVLVAFSRAL
ncbi:hypothetical protein EMCRGX_G012116 [Ephydatia muelleri]